MIVNIVDGPNISAKSKISTNIILYSRFHRSGRAIATMKAYNFLNDVAIIHDIDSISYTVITIPSRSKGKERNSNISSPLGEI